MNLGITPTNFKNNYYSMKNYQNNQQQSFRAMKFRIFRHPEESINLLSQRKRDEGIDIFMGIFEDTAKKLGFNTDKLSEEGNSIGLIPKSPSSSKMMAIFLDRGNNVVKVNQHSIMAEFNRGSALSEGEYFAYAVKESLKTNA